MKQCGNSSVEGRKLMKYRAFLEGSRVQSLGTDRSTEGCICVKASSALTTFSMIIHLSSTMEKKFEDHYPHRKKFLDNI